MKFHIISGEVSDQLTQRVNDWIHERELARDDAIRKWRGDGLVPPKGSAPPAALFEIITWQVTHDPNFIYWSCAYNG